MNFEEIEKVELELLLEVLYHRYGYDFRHYARTSVRRRARHILTKSGQKRLSDLIPLLLYDEEFAGRAVCYFSIMVTEMFHDPGFYRKVRGICHALFKNIFPHQNMDGGLRHR